MKLDDFLKCKKVRCVDGDATTITTGKIYDVIGVNETFIHVIDDNGEEACYWYCRFEPVLVDNCQANIQDIGTDILDTNADIKDTPKFKVGDKVYTGLTGDIKTIDEIVNEYPPIYKVVSKQGYTPRLKQEAIALATQENYERLQSTFTEIEFEQPPKPLTGSDLARAMLDKGWKYVPCYVSNYGESEAQKPCIVRKFSSSGQFVSDFEFYNHAVPFDPKTGEHLTQAVLDE